MCKNYHILILFVFSIPCVAALSLASAAMAVTSVASSSTSTAASVAAASSSSAYWCFTDYCRGDIYSYALVMWEVLSRTILAPDVDNGEPLTQQPNDNQQQPSTDNRYNPFLYRAPYQDRGVGWDPGFDDMRSIVCSTDPVQSRPGVASEWLANPVRFLIFLKYYAPSIHLGYENASNDGYIVYLLIIKCHNCYLS